MKQPRKRTSNRGYQLTSDAVRAVQEQRSPLYQLSPKGIAFVQDCKAKLGAIAETENLPRPTAEKSHVDLVNDVIDEMELKEALLLDYERMLTRLKLLPLDAYDEYKAALDEIRRIRETIYAIEQGLKP